MPDASEPPPAVHVRVDDAPSSQPPRRFTRAFAIGRSEGCDLQVLRPKVSRHHAEVVYEEGGWWIVDCNSANGTYLNGERIRRARLEGTCAVQLGHGGPVLTLQVEDAPEAAAPTLVRPDAHTRVHEVPTTPASAALPPPLPPPGAPREPAVPSAGGVPARRRSLDEVAAHYFGDSDEPAGEHTMLIRQAYRVVQQRQQQRWIGIGAAMAILVVLAGGYAVWQQIRANRLEAQLSEVYAGVRALDAEILKIRHFIAERGDASLEEQLEGLQAQRERQIALLEGYVEELGYRRRLTDEERVIHKVARVFNESEFVIPSSFIRRVREEMQTYWLTPSGRHRYEQAIRRAQQEGYPQLIAQTMLKYNLPPEFFYLSMVESDFDNRGAIGPRTRWGIAKGMWQFIPETAANYGLKIGPRQDDPIYDPADERFDPVAATDAAARYLLEIHSQLAGASGLLAMASYNWGERRVVSRMERLFQDIPDEVAERTYWRFYTEYQDRMPEETKKYVVRIFAAAVIGEDPRLFGFDFDNPLAPYLASPDTPASPAAWSP
ncbi:hypothetical protein AWN76_001540 [Rhodothermaceae bacterium RA]|nr:hypothetical protein AWN76_001540 [Rhodothermaceae bacterium RA]